MPTLDATTTAVFTSVGLNAETIYDIFVSLVGSAVSFGLWLVQVSWPFLLCMFLHLLWVLLYKYLTGSQHYLYLLVICGLDCLQNLFFQKKKRQKRKPPKGIMLYIFCFLGSS